MNYSFFAAGRSLSILRLTILGVRGKIWTRRWLAHIGGKKERKKGRVLACSGWLAAWQSGCEASQRGKPARQARQASHVSRARETGPSVSSSQPVASRTRNNEMRRGETALEGFYGIASY